MNQKKPDESQSAFFRGLTPDPILSVSQWCEQNMRLSTSVSALPGRWSNDVFPYLVEIMDCLGPESEYNEVVFMKASQVGGTQILLNWLGFIIHYSPGPTMIVQPNIDLAKRLSKQRVSAMLRDCECFKGKIKNSRERDSGNTSLMKSFEGGVAVFSGAQSAATLRSMPVEKLGLDEIDAYPDDCEGEGDPIELAEARQRTFGRKKRLFLLSSPTFSGRSKIEKRYDKSDRRKFHIHCTHCQHPQFMRFDQLKWTEKSGIVTDAVYECEKCALSIQEYKKPIFLREGKWIKACPESPVAGFHISTLYSPLGFFSWKEIAAKFIASKSNPLDLVVFVNTILGETFKIKGDAPDWEILYSRREAYKIGTVPDHVAFITAGCDVQKDRLEIEICGWAPGKESFSIDFRVLYGDTGDPDGEVWKLLDRLMMEQFPRTDGSLLPIKMTAIDSGYNTQTVYNWARRYPITRVIATKGTDSAQVIIGSPSVVDVDVAGRKIKRGFRVWPIGVSVAKSEFYSWLKLPRPTDGERYPGYCHFPEHNEEFFKQLTAEQIVVRVVNGYRRYMWEKTRERNEALDCRILNRAAAAVVGIDRFTPEHWEQLKYQAAPAPIGFEDQPQTASAKSPKPEGDGESFW